MPETNEAFKIILQQGGVFSALFVIACAVIVVLCGAIVIQYREAGKDRKSCAEDSAKCEGERRDLYERYVKDVQTVIGALERSTLATTTGAVATDARSRAVADMTDALRKLADGAESARARSIDRAERMEQRFAERVERVDSILTELAKGLRDVEQQIARIAGRLKVD